MFDYGMQPCLEDFEEIVGTPFLESELDMVLLTPNDLGWDRGPRHPLRRSTRRRSAARADRRREWAVTASVLAALEVTHRDRARWIASLASSTRREPPAAS